NVASSSFSPATSAEISAEVGTDAATLRAVLKPWIDSGEVERTGQRRGTRYSRRGGGGEQSDTPPDGPTGRQGELF
ncbi:MAG: hypothetical protein ACE5GW_07940, partial [Planctomycetota bacterium]